MTNAFGRDTAHSKGREMLSKTAMVVMAAISQMG
jgi:hypothetical protein